MQIFQILSGQVSAVGIRATQVCVLGHLRESWGNTRFNKWATIVNNSFAATGLKQILYGKKYTEKSRFYADVWYAKNASLGIDYYILWRTFIKIFFSI